MRSRVRHLLVVGVLATCVFAGRADAVSLSTADLIVEDNGSVIRLKRPDGLLENRPVAELSPEESALLNEHRAQHPPAASLTRKEARNRPRPLLINKDGIRVKSGVENLHEAILEGTVRGYEEAPGLTTVVLSSGSRFWEPQFKSDHGDIDSFWPDILKELEAQHPDNAVRQDPFVACVEYIKGLDKEVFWSLRVNDTHDHKLPPDKLHGWKRRKAMTTDKDGAPFLIGTIHQKPRYGRPNALNFDNSEVRQKLLQVVEVGLQKMARHHRLDGLELDFARHATLFRSVAHGSRATDKQLRLITDMLRHIRKVADEIGAARGRPVLIMVRIPDSAEFCRVVGIDLNTWFKEGLVDLAVNSDYYVLSTWKEFADFCHQHDVKYYACLERRRIEHHVPHSSRSASMSVPVKPELWRGEALNAWNGGVDGIYIFNRPSTRADVLGLNLHDPEALRKLHFPEIILRTERTPHSPWTHPDRWAPAWKPKTKK